MSASKSPFVEKLLGTASAHDIEFDCYGKQDCDGFEVIQVALKGGDVDLFDALSKSVIKDLAAALDREFLDDSNRDEFDRQFFNAA